MMKVCCEKEKSMKKFLFILLIFMLAACGSANPLLTKESSVDPADFKTISVDELSQAMKTKDFLLINVYIPVEGNIPGTDLDLPFNEIEKQIKKLPADKDAKIILYCRSGNKSRTAAQTLVGLGYTNIFNLAGGYTAWEAAGNQFSEE